jgi:hypothetical protein
MPAGEDTAAEKCEDWKKTNHRTPGSHAVV